LWTQMMGQFFLHLRNYRTAESNDTPQTAGAASDSAASSGTTTEAAGSASA
jgi:hypothetical protein